MDTHLYRDQLSIDTPEQVDLRLPVAGLGSRFLAAIVDILIQITAYVAILLVLALLITLALPKVRTHLDTLSNTAGNWLIAGYILLNFLFFWGYYTLFEALWHGQTPGKRVAHIRVVKDSGREITLFEAMTRNLLRIVDLLPSFYVVGVIAILAGKQNKRLGDLLAGTLVLHQEQTGPAERAPHTSRTFTAGIHAAPLVTMPLHQDPLSLFGITFPVEAINRLSPQDLVMLDTLFLRIVDLDPITTDRLSSQMLSNLCTRMGVGIPADAAPRRCLESIAWQLRSLGTFR